jgi:DNA-directed RNA polymerase subunit N (RpoN/RPB10)
MDTIRCLGCKAYLGRVAAEFNLRKAAGENTADLLKELGVTLPCCQISVGCARNPVGDITMYVYHGECLAADIKAAAAAAAAAAAGAGAGTATASV